MTSSFVRFCVVTLLSLTVSFGGTIALHEYAGWPEEFAYAVALATAFLMNFLFLRGYIFPSRDVEPGRQFLVYALSAAGFRASEYALFLLVHTLLGVHYILTMIAIQGATFVIKFFFYGGVVFRGEGTGPKG